MLTRIYSNIIFWWSIFVLITLTYLFLLKLSGNFSGGVNYFIFQEALGLIFLIFLGAGLQFFILILKVGVSPFHFWVYRVISYLDGYLLMWFLTFQKLPFLAVLSYLFSFKFFFLLRFGIFVCYLQIYVLKNFKYLFFVSSTESFNWLFFSLILGASTFLFFSIYYILNMMILIFYINFSFSFPLLETSLVFLNIPLSVSFFLKIFMLFLGVNLLGRVMLFLLIFIFLSSLSFLFWLSLYSLKNSSLFKDSYHLLYFILFITGFFAIF